MDSEWTVLPEYFNSRGQRKCLVLTSLVILLYYKNRAFSEILLRNTDKAVDSEK